MPSCGQLTTAGLFGPLRRARQIGGQQPLVERRTPARVAVILLSRRWMNALLGSSPSYQSNRQILAQYRTIPPLQLQPCETIPSSSVIFFGKADSRRALNERSMFAKCLQTTFLGLVQGVSGQLKTGANLLIWRRKRDSNPRASYPANGFQDRRLRPLGHSSDFKLPDFAIISQSAAIAATRRRQGGRAW